MDIIKRAFDVLASTINDDEEILDLFKQFYFEIANNNSRLETQIREEILERNVREREQEDLDRINKSKQSFKASISVGSKTNTISALSLKSIVFPLSETFSSLIVRTGTFVFTKDISSGNFDIAPVAISV